MKKSLLISLLVFIVLTACTTLTVPNASSSETRTLVKDQTPTQTSLPAVIAIENMVPLATSTPDHFNSFYQGCLDGTTVEITCLYVPGILSVSVERGGHEDLPISGVILWDLPWKESQLVSILAHEIFDGYKFHDIQMSNEISIIWSTGKVDNYIVSEISKWRDDIDWRYFSPWSGGNQVSVSQLANIYYNGNYEYKRLVLQTCLPNQEGVLFIVANLK